ncbi:MAG: hypothetical protein GY859_06045, partial [Desulfobacterales bacterium]|nr:hypothetical protein [Desulfobacterales bacterium]
MSEFSQKETRLSTTSGAVTIRSFFRPEEIADLSMDSFTRHSQYNPIIT